jgi:hypothetical protein
MTTLPLDHAKGWERIPAYTLSDPEAIPDRFATCFAVKAKPEFVQITFYVEREGRPQFQEIGELVVSGRMTLPRSRARDLADQLRLMFRHEN